MYVFPRVFYGRAQSRALDDAAAVPGSFSADPVYRGVLNPDTADIGTNAFKLERAYEEARMAGYDENGKPIDPNDFKRFAENEDG